MDAEGFDDLARTLLTANSRRSLLAGLTSGLLAEILGYSQSGATKDDRKP